MILLLCYLKCRLAEAQLAQANSGRNANLNRIPITYRYPYSIRTTPEPGTWVERCTCSCCNRILLRKAIIEEIIPRTTGEVFYFSSAIRGSFALLVFDLIPEASHNKVFMNDVGICDALMPLAIQDKYYGCYSSQTLIECLLTRFPTDLLATMFSFYHQMFTIRLFF